MELSLDISSIGIIRIYVYLNSDQETFNHNKKGALEMQSLSKSLSF